MFSTKQINKQHSYTLYQREKTTMKVKDAEEFVLNRTPFMD